jgi:hypothetical protein
LSTIIDDLVKSNESPRRKQRGILADHQFFYAASGGEYNPKRLKVEKMGRLRNKAAGKARD